MINNNKAYVSRNYRIGNLQLGGDLGGVDDSLDPHLEFLPPTATSPHSSNLNVALAKNEEKDVMRF